jgi:Fe-S-cluster-containing dehydrogenase component
MAGLFNGVEGYKMSKAFVIDVARCSGCYTCQVACKDEYVGNDWLPYSKSQPDIGQFWLRLNEYIEGTVPKVRMHFIPALCNHCEKPACVGACPNGAIEKRADDGLVILSPEKCKGCGDCRKSCPYDAIYFNEELNISQKCTGCAHLLDNGYKLPRCVEACPTDAMSFGDEEELADLIRGATVLRPESGLMPKVYYRNIPGKFIAGMLYDPDIKEVVIGAKVRASSGGKHLEAYTDEFGDFWFNDIAVGKYDVFIEADGYEPKGFQDIDTEKSVNLGEIPLVPIGYPPNGLR